MAILSIITVRKREIKNQISSLTVGLDTSLKEELGREGRSLGPYPLNM